MIGVLEFPPSHSLAPILLGMGYLNRDLCSPSLVSGRWGHQPALVPRWQQSPGYHSLSCISVSGRRTEEESKNDLRKALRFWNFHKAEPSVPIPIL